MAAVSFYYFYPNDYENRLFNSETIIKGKIPGTSISASLRAGKTVQTMKSLVIRGNPYEIGIDVLPNSLIKGSVKITGVKLTETETGAVIYKTETVFIRAFKKQTHEPRSYAHFQISDVNIPYRDCTLHFDLVASGPWGTKDATITIPFERKFKTYQAIPAWEGLKGL